MTPTRPGAPSSLSTRPSKLGIPAGPLTTVAWPFTPSTRPSSSARKPFMTASTTISVPTPKAIPPSAKPAMTEMKPSPLVGRRYRQATRRSNRPNAIRARSAPPASTAEMSCFSPGRPVLQLDPVLRSAARADHDLPGQPDQFHGRELDARPLVAVVHQHLDAQRMQPRVQILGERGGGGIVGAQVDQPDLERRHALRPDDALLVVERLDQRTDEA